MPEKLIEARFAALAADVQAATAALDADRAERVAAREAEENRTSWWRRLTVLAAVGSVLGIVGALGAYMAVNQLAADRRQGQVSSCNAYNSQTVPPINRLNDRTQALLGAVAATSSPETAAFVDEQIALYEADKALFRDCSPGGIRAFSEGDGGYLPLGVEP